MNVKRKSLVAVVAVVVLLGIGAALVTELRGSTGFSPGSSMGLARQPRAHSIAPEAGRANFPAETAPSESATQLGKVVPAQSPDVIYTGSIAISVRKAHLLSAFDQVTADAESQGGFVADSSSESQSLQAPTASLVVRVPSARFTALVIEVSTLGKVRSQQVHGQDVTGLVVNLSARITNLEAEQQALRNLVQRAGSIPNILQVQNELFSVESEIEQLSAEQASLDNQTTYATLTVDLAVSVPPATRKPRAENTFSRAVKLAWHNLAAAGRAVVLGVSWAFPLLIAAALAYAAWRLRRRRRLATPSPAGP